MIAVPQTSGDLLVAVPENKTELFLVALESQGVDGRYIGRVTALQLPSK